MSLKLGGVENVSIRIIQTPRLPPKPPGNQCLLGYQEVYSMEKMNPKNPNCDEEVSKSTVVKTGRQEKSHILNGKAPASFCHPN